VLKPDNPHHLAEALRAASAVRRSICLEGSRSKRLMAGPVETADECISTTALNHVLQ
jgi:hypothetical protein